LNRIQLNQNQLIKYSHSNRILYYFLLNHNDKFIKNLIILFFFLNP
jgi:hypothetical protein